MKNIIILALCAFLISCQSIYKHQKEYSSERSRTFNKPYDSIVKKIKEFTEKENPKSKIIAIMPNLVLIEERFNEEQAFRYSDYDPQKDNFTVLEEKEELIINIKSDSAKTTVDIKTAITGDVMYQKFLGKALEKVNKNVDFSSTGAREKEVLDFINSNN